MNIRLKRHEINEKELSTLALGIRVLPLQWGSPPLQGVFRAQLIIQQL
jgi:hypothetical protein